MFGLLRTAIRPPVQRLAVTGQRFPFVPADTVFDAFPHFCRDKVWYLSFHVAATCVMAAGLFWWGHTPFAGADYDHGWESPLYKYKMKKLRDSGEMAENARIKVTSLYPQTEGAEDDE